MTKGEEARALFLQGYNCAQSVLLPFAGELGMNREEAAKLASSFGAGMGRMREICGAVSAMLMVAGARWGYADPAATAEKAAHYRRVRDLAAEFRAASGSIICRELLAGLDVAEGGAPEERTAEYYARRPCADLIARAAGILEKTASQP